MINALKLLANQQEDGDGVLQNIVQDLVKESRKGLTDGMREFIRIDNECAWRRPKAPEGCPEVMVWDGPGELTLRAEEVRTWKSYVNVDHIAKERCGPPLVDYDWHAFCQALFQGIEGNDWKEMYESYKEMRRAVGVRKQEAQKAKALFKMKAPKDRREEFYDPERKGNILGRKNETGTVGKAPQRSNWCVGQIPEVRGKSVLKVLAQAQARRCFLQWLMVTFFEFGGSSQSGRASGPAWMHWILCVLRTASMEWNVPEKFGPHSVLFFFLIQKKPAVDSAGEEFKSFIGDSVASPGVERMKVSLLMVCR